MEEKKTHAYFQTIIEIKESSKKLRSHIANPQWTFAALEFKIHRSKLKCKKAKTIISDVPLYTFVVVRFKKVYIKVQKMNNNFRNLEIQHAYFQTISEVSK